MPFMDNGQYKIWFEDECFAPPWRPRDTLVIQHGFGRNSAFWRHWVPKLSDTYRIVRPDLRGHGRSTSSPAPWSFEELVDDLAEFIQELGAGKVHLLGEASGGMLAIGLAALHPNLVKSLITSSTPQRIDPDHQRFFSAGRESWREAILQLGSKGWAEWLIAQPGTVAQMGRRQRQWWLEQFALTPSKVLADLSDVLIATDVTPLLPHVAVPALVLAPMQSAATSIAEQVKLAETIPNACLQPINGVGHEIYIDKVEECVAAVRQFLAKVNSPPRPTANLVD